MTIEADARVTISAAIFGVAALVTGLTETVDAQPTPKSAADEVVIAGELTEAVAAQAPLSDDTVATAPKPKGFRYSILREVLIDDMDSTRLYVKRSKRAKTTTAVPIPKDRPLLAECVDIGKVDDLQRGATITARYDPRGACAR